MARHPMALIRKRSRWGYFFIAPVVVLFLIFRIYPIVRSLSLSFFQWNILNPAKPFVAFQNYAKMFSNDVFWQSMSNTLVYTVASVFLGTALSLALALLVNNRRFTGRAAFKFIYFLPVITPMVAAAFIWKWMYQPQLGMINGIFRALGLPPQRWIQSAKQAMLSVIIFSMWKSAGYNMVIFIAGLEGIPETFREAALIDGANAAQTFRRITIPLLMPTTIFVLIMSTISALQVFAPIYVMTEGGPVNATRVVILHIYKTAFDYLEFGYASAMATVLFIFILAITILQLGVFGKRGEAAY